MLTASLPQSSQIAVYRTPARDDALISPFLLDPKSITFLTKHSPRSHRGVWLHMPVMVRLVQTREQAMHHVNYLSRLRHPNLEPFLGAVVDDREQKAVITEFVNGRSIKEMLSRRSLTPHIALTVALDVARALVYLQATTGRPHAGVRPESVLFDQLRCRAVVLLSSKMRYGPPCAAPEVSDGYKWVGLPADVYSLAALLLQMFLSINGCNDQHADQPRVHFLPAKLQQVVWRALQKAVALRPSIEELCEALTDCQNAFW